jgi:hypothetical protein
VRGKLHSFVHNRRALFRVPNNGGYVQEDSSKDNTEINATVSASPVEIMNAFERFRERRVLQIEDHSDPLVQLVMAIGCGMQHSIGTPATSQRRVYLAEEAARTARSVRE